MSVTGFAKIEEDPETIIKNKTTNQYNHTRYKLADYFISDVGSVPWQNKYI